MDDVSNRPWPVPDEPWTNAQSWIDLCFLHWRVDEGALRKLVPDSVDAERYCLYTEDGGRLYRAEIHHPPWDLQRGDARIDLNTMAPVSLPDEEPHVLFCPRQDVVLWSLDEVE